MQALPSWSFFFFSSRRRHTRLQGDWSSDVCSSDLGPRLVSVTARRNGLSASQLFTWRRLAREDRLSGDAVPALVPVEIAFTPAPGSTCTPQPPSSPPAQRASVGIIEIELSGGCRVRVDRDVDAEALQRVLELLRRR